MKNIKIESKLIGKDEPVFIIAEAGVNHNGSLKMAKQLIEEAKNSGADCVKFQTFKAECVVTEQAPKARHQLETTDKSESQLDMLKKLELNYEDHLRLMQYAQDLGIIFISTPYNFEDVDLLESLGVSAYKIASGQIIEIPFLKKIAKTGKSIFLSTGMATVDEVTEALEAIESEGNSDIILLQCTTNYPSSVSDANLNVIKNFQNK